MTHTEFMVYAELARRKVQFHADKDWHQIDLWGLFKLSQIARMVKDGKLLLCHRVDPTMTMVWVKPSLPVWQQCVKPLVDKHTLRELTVMAGWSAG